MDNLLRAIILNGEEIDTVFCDTYKNGTPILSKNIKKSLIERDGYNPNIKVFMDTIGKEQRPRLI